MSQTIKIQVLAFLQNPPESKHDQFNEAYELYKKSEGKNYSVERKLNVVGFTEEGLKNLLYDLQQMHGITDVEIMDKPVIQLTDPLVEACEIFGEAFAQLAEATQIAILHAFKFTVEFAQQEITSQSLQELLDRGKTDFEAFIEGNPELKSLFDTLEFNDVVAFLLDRIEAAEYPEDLLPQIEEMRELKKQAILKEDEESLQSLSTKVFEHTEISDADDSTGGKFVAADEIQPLREEYPFLNDANCPDVFFIVVGRKLSAYRRWQAAHAKLVSIDSGELEVDEKEKLETAQLVESSFRENQDLHAELNYYKEHGEILGKHSLFRESVAKREVEQMTNDEMRKFIGSSSKYFSTKKKARLTNALKPEKVAQIDQDVKDREYKLALVKAKFGAADAAAK